MATDIVWSQKDRETAAEQARRAVIALQTTVQNAADVLDEADTSRAKHLPENLTTELHAAEQGLYRVLTIVQAFDYCQARCLEEGLTPEFAKDAWQLYAIADFLNELVEAESYGPNAMGMVDRHILGKIGLDLDTV